MDEYEKLSESPRSERMRQRGYSDGGLAGYENGGQPQQDDAMMQQYSQQQPQQGGNDFVPLEQRQPGAAASGRWGAPNTYMESINAGRDSLDMQDKEMIRQKALNAIQRLRLDSLADDYEIRSRDPEPYGVLSPVDSLQARDESEYLKQQMLQRSPESVLQGIMQPNDTRGMYR